MIESFKLQQMSILPITGLQGSSEYGALCNCTHLHSQEPTSEEAECIVYFWVKRFECCL
jgi:hypothetical protein